MGKRKQKPTWMATLAQLVADVEAETKVPAPRALKDAFLQVGFDPSGAFSRAELDEAVANVKKGKA